MRHSTTEVSIAVELQNELFNHLMQTSYWNLRACVVVLVPFRRSDYLSLCVTSASFGEGKVGKGEVIMPYIPYIPQAAVGPGAVCGA